ncbi:MAG: S9 family peptidase [Saprospiraceae bacterium]|nr:S9 family peptidase [Saprospiraceae bacterium]
MTHGAHTVDRFMHDGKRVFYTRSSFDKPAEIYQSGLTMPGEAQQLTFINEEALKTVRLSKFEERYCKTFDGKQLQSWVVFPPDFDPKKKYPVVLYCQGGPQSPMNSQWGTRWSMQLIAAQGFIVIAPNRRGTFGFGVEWTKTISKNWESGTKDLLAAIDDFSKEPFVDKNRMAAVGGSFGGYSVFWLAGHHNGRFKCFISHCGLFNLESFYLTTDELFFADYDMGASFWRATDNPTFTKFNPIKMVKNWNTPILIIQGGQDFRVPESEGFQAFQAAQLQGIKSQFLYFPTEGHWIKRPQNSVRWQREFMGWLNEHLH